MNLHRGVLLFASMTLLSPLARADDDAELERLRAMPLQRREALLKNLERFDALPRDEQAAIAKLDKGIRAEDPVTQARYLATLHRYHLWLSTLSEEDRRKVLAAGPEERMKLVKSLREAEKKASPRRPDFPWIQVTPLSTATLEDQVHWVRIWFALDAAEREQVNKLRTQEERIKLLEQFGREKQITDDRRRLETEETRLLEKGVVERPAFKKRVGALKAQYKGNPKGFEAEKSRIRNEIVRRLMRNHMGELQILKKQPNPPVSDAELGQFLALLPTWFLETVDSLPPESAKRRIQTICRLIHPDGKIPPPEAVKPRGPAEKAAPAPPSKDAEPPTTSPF